MAGPGNILIKVGAEAGQAIRELSTVDKALGDTMSTSEKMGAGLQKAALPAAAALTALAAGGIAAAKAAAEDASARAKMIGNLERATHATEAQAAATDDWIEKLTLATGVADDQLRPALSRLARSTGDVHEAQTALGVALDVSAATGKDLGAVANAIGKAYDGSTTSLARLGVGLDAATLKSKDMSAIMSELATKTGGAMAEQAATASGQYAIFTNQMRELEETLGAALLPVLQALLPILNSFAGFAAENTTAIKILVGAIAALSAGILLANAAMKAYAAAQAVVKIATTAWTAAQWLLNAALTANPIGLVIAAIAALGAALVIAYTKSQTFRNIVGAAFAAVEVAAQAVASAFRAIFNAASSAFDWIVAHWRVGALALGPIGVAIVVLADHFNALEKVAVGVFGAIKAAVDSVYGAIESAIGLVGRLVDAVSHLHIPHIPGLSSFAVPVAPALAARGLGAAPASSSSSSLTINVYGAVDPEGTARYIRKLLSDHDRRQGR